MINMLTSFLSERTFQVNVDGNLSRKLPLENGVPQGSVLSVTLFLVAIQPIFRVVPNTVTVLLYADDILLVVRGKKEQPLYRKLQSAVKAVHRWAKSVGFTISATKSSIFYCSPNARREPTQSIRIDTVAIPSQNQLKTLGITLDRSLNFKAHCKLTKKACESRLRILKMIGAKLPRGQRTSLLQIGSAIVTSRLLYGMGLVSRGGEVVTKTLAPAYNRMVRFASGAFVTSPILAIMAEAGTLPFDLLVLQSITRLSIRLLEKSRDNADLPLVRRASEELSEVIGMPLPNICTRTRLATRKWYEPQPHVVWDIKRSVNAGDPSEVVRPVVKELLNARFSNSTVVYTDGSKDDDAVGAGMFGEHLQQSTGLPPQCSVFSAEAFAIKTAVTSYYTSNDLLIMTDSASCLSAIEAGTSQHPWIQEIETMIRHRPINLCWIPGHAGIRGNEEADRLAGEARGNAPLQIAIPGADANNQAKSAIRNHWYRRWSASTEVKLREIKFDTVKWTDRESSADQRVLTLLRIGHTRLTHDFLLKRETPPVCDCCGVTVDVRHIILQCRKHDDARRMHNIDSTSLRVALGNDGDTEDKLLSFLKETNLYKRI
ncbi:uncharacterized protein LOC131695767 [Topomyia yanbarensis]|uniref:uncharacterized protein LOC131695767 n=1 Tax=Topomyia yanbarensis TaxID=2498891 RepID=UPI00273C4593|nr:uncharacterized protein LOC131695767 [Topomyia yanbarensis]